MHAVKIGERLKLLDFSGTNIGTSGVIDLMTQTLNFNTGLHLLNVANTLVDKKIKNSDLFKINGEEEKDEEEKKDEAKGEADFKFLKNPSRIVLNLEFFD